MADDMPSPPLVYEGLDPSPEPKSTIEEVSEAFRGAANRVGDVIEKGKKPGSCWGWLWPGVAEAECGNTAFCNSRSLDSMRFTAGYGLAGAWL